VLVADRLSATLVALAAVLALLLAAAGLASAAELKRWEGGATPAMVVEDLKGRPHDLSEYKGKVVLVNFWATWCKPCTTEMPAMQTTYDKLRDKGFVVLAINELEDEAKVREHIEQYGHTFPVLMDRDNKIANQFGVFGLPVSVFIDEKGVVQQYIKGGLLTEQVILDVVARIQKQEPVKAASLR